MTPSNSHDNLALLAQRQPYSHVELKPINLDFEHNGKTYSITFVKKKVGGEKGEEKNLDLTKLKPNDIVALVAQAKKAMDTMEKLDGAATLKDSKSFTFHFTTQMKEPTFLNNMLGHKFKRFAYKPNPTMIDSITYKEGLEDKKFTVNLSKYESSEQMKIQKNLQPLSTTIDRLFIESAQEEKPLKLSKHKAETPVQQAESTESETLPDSRDQLNSSSADLPRVNSIQEAIDLSSLESNLLE